MTKQKFADGCHRWGWLIAILVGVAGQLIVVSVLAGQTTERINSLGAGIQSVKDDVNNRMNQLERRLDDVIRQRN